MTRAEAIKQVLEWVGPEDLVVCTTGMITREAFTLKDRPANFYLIGSLGLISALGLGLALMSPRRRVVLLDGDGSALLSLGNFAMIGREHPANLLYCVLDNECYESTGSQPSISREIDLASVAQASGFAWVETIRDGQELSGALEQAAQEPGPGFLLTKVSSEGTHGIGRLTIEPDALTRRFQEAVIGASKGAEAHA